MQLLHYSISKTLWYIFMLCVWQSVSSRQALSLKLFWGYLICMYQAGWSSQPLLLNIPWLVHTHSPTIHFLLYLLLLALPKRIVTIHLLLRTWLGCFSIPHLPSPKMLSLLVFSNNCTYAWCHTVQYLVPLFNIMFCIKCIDPFWDEKVPENRDWITHSFTVLQSHHRSEDKQMLGRTLNRCYFS